MKLLTVISAAAVLACVSSLCFSQAGKDKAAAIALLERMIAALNTRDEAKLRDFLQANATDEIPINDRVERLMGFAQQGSPFRLESASVVTANEVKAQHHSPCYRRRSAKNEVASGGSNECRSAFGGCVELENLA
jgi:hypothetical protein